MEITPNPSLTAAAATRTLPFEAKAAVIMYAGPDTMLHTVPTAMDPLAVPVRFPSAAAADEYAVGILYDLALHCDLIFSYRISERLTRSEFMIVYTLSKVETI